MMEPMHMCLHEQTQEEQKLLVQKSKDKGTTWSLSLDPDGTAGPP